MSLSPWEAEGKRPVRHYLIGLTSFHGYVKLNFLSVAFGKELASLSAPPDLPDNLIRPISPFPLE